MPERDRLREVEERLAELEEQLSGLEKALNLSPLEEKVRLQQRIRELRKDMQPYEVEKWQIISSRTAAMEIPESEAEVAVAEIVEGVTQLETRPIGYSDEVLDLLRQIRAKLNEPGPSASGKLKAVISSFPPFLQLSYEVEVDTENLAKKYFPTFSQLVSRAAKK